MRAARQRIATNEDNRLSAPTFWRDSALPFVEARFVPDGRTVCYAPHAHETFSIGAITQGRNVYVNGRAHLPVTTGSVVIMNPGDVHCCNPIDEGAWSYLMLYVDTGWLGEIQQRTNTRRTPGFQRFSTVLTTNRHLFEGLNRLHDVLTDTGEEGLRKHAAMITFFSGLQHALDAEPAASDEPNPRIVEAADYLRDNRTRAIKLDELCASTGLSAPYLIRAFKRRYGMTPHAYLVNARIEYARALLKRGNPIAEVAIDAGFSDQAHLQRAFKRHMAATPGQYRDKR